MKYEYFYDHGKKNIFYSFQYLYSLLNLEASISASILDLLKADSAYISASTLDLLRTLSLANLDASI